VKKITKPFVFLEVSATNEYGQGAQMADRNPAQPAAPTQPSPKPKKSASG
jgi:hypothetical protein